MGWQSYYIEFDTEIQEKEILDTIRSHNNETNWHIVGEQLILVRRGVFKRRTTRGKYLILFGNGGGREQTFEYFDNKGFAIQPFSRNIDGRIKEKIEIQL